MAKRKLGYSRGISSLHDFGDHVIDFAKMKTVTINGKKYHHDGKTGIIYTTCKMHADIPLEHFTADEFVELREQVRN